MSGVCQVGKFSQAENILLKCQQLGEAKHAWKDVLPQRQREKHYPDVAREAGRQVGGGGAADCCSLVPVQDKVHFTELFVKIEHEGKLGADTGKVCANFAAFLQV